MSGDRYSRSILFGGIGQEGQEKFAAFRIAIVGVGAIGTVAAEIAARAGIGMIRLLDRDIVDESNLQRQFLFDEDDASSSRPKADAAAGHLAKINSAVRIESRVRDVDFRNVDEILSGVDLVVDASDNFETRLLVSDFGKKEAIPVASAACVGSEAQVLMSLPGPEWPCLRCYLTALPPVGSGPTCDTSGVVPSLPPLVASIAMGEVLRLATGATPSRGVLTMSIWEGNLQPVRAFAEANPSVMCDACAGRRYPALEGEGASETVRLCGRRSVQVSSDGRVRPDFDRLEKELSAFGSVQRTENVLSAAVEGVTLTLFSDGRCVVRGTEDFARARGLVARYLGG